MTHINELHRIVRQLSNNCYVRWWAAWPRRSDEPWKIAISCIDGTGKPIEVYEHDLPKPFEKIEQGGLIYYVFDRTDENGEPFKLEPIG